MSKERVVPRMPAALLRLPRREGRINHWLGTALLFYINHSNIKPAGMTGLLNGAILAEGFGTTMEDVGCASKTRPQLL